MKFQHDETHNHSPLIGQMDDEWFIIRMYSQKILLRVFCLML